MERNVEIIKDAKGKQLVKINDIRFKGKRSVDWNEVKEYLEEYVGQFFQIASSEDVIYIGSKLPDEYTGSRYTHGLKGTAAKAKANAAQGIPELIEIATDKHFKENQGNKELCINNSVVSGHNCIVPIWMKFIPDYVYGCQFLI